VRVAQPRRALDYGERPDPAAGIFETLLVQGRSVVRYNAHRERMNASAQALYGVAPPAAVTPPQVRPGNGALRLTFVPGAGLSVHERALSADPVVRGFAPFELPGGLGPHKWVDRRLLDALTQAADGELVLLIDSDGAVLEASWASVLIEERGRLIAPLTAGRALPGIGRSRLSYDEEPVDLDRLLASDAVVLTSALRVLRIANR
jgi:para-aminobenzoate synthetase/4-amino-4-deoxychorismate lyase